MQHNNKTDAFTVGKYLISPLIHTLDNDWFACSVSIRSGCGGGAIDRVLRFTRLFRDRLAASDYALAEGMRWIAAATPQVRPV